MATSTRKKPAKPKVTSKAKPKAKAEPKAPPKPKHSFGSLARRKAALVDQLRDRPGNEAEIRAELEGELLAPVPVLSHQELQRLED